VLAAALRIPVPGGVIEVEVVGRHAALPEDALVSWAEKAGRAVAAYYGTFPLPSVELTIRAGGPGGISGGRTGTSRGKAAIRIAIGDEATPQDLASNWVLVHEMVHLAFPSMTGHEWIEEGIATYVEPLARARAGLAPRDEIWRWLLWGLPRGLEAIRSRGLDSASSWAANYWGGALYCFLADVEIRKRTGNRKSLDDALRGILRAGGNVTVSWPLEKALAEGDRASGVPVLAELYATMRHGPVRVDLADDWKNLGVSSAGGRIVYDDAASLAAIRRGITTGTPDAKRLESRP
jgi:hypothetical protein